MLRNDNISYRDVNTVNFLNAEPKEKHYWQQKSDLDMFYY